MVVKAIQIDTVADSFKRNLKDAGNADMNSFTDYYNQNIRDQMKVDNGMFFRYNVLNILV